MLSFNMASLNMLGQYGLSDSVKLKLLREMDYSLLKQVAYFAREKEHLSSKEVLEVKERQASGEATSFIATALK